MEELSDWRDRIDAIDVQLVALLNQRAQCALDAGRYKHELAVCDPDRELNVLRHVEQLNHLSAGPLPQPALRHLFEHIVAAMRKLQDQDRGGPREERRRRPRVRPPVTKPST